MQLKVSKNLRFFEEMTKNKFGLDDYIDINKMTIFFGVYSEDDINALEMHKGKRIIFWGGSDAMNDKMLKRVRKLEAFHIAQSSFISFDLARYGIDSTIIHLLNTDMDKFKPCPLGKNIYWYKGNRSFYGKKMFYKIRQVFPDIKFIVRNNPEIPHDQMPDVYESCFLGIRPVEHDGCSQTIGEMGLMGRKCIYNGDTPNAIRFRDEDDIIKKIRELMNGYDYKKVAEEVKRFYLKSDKQFINLLKTYEEAN